MKEGERGPFSPKLRVRIKDNNSSPHGKFYRFLFPFSSKFSDLNFASYVLYIYLHTVSLGNLWIIVFNFAPLWAILLKSLECNADALGIIAGASAILFIAVFFFFILKSLSSIHKSQEQGVNYTTEQKIV